jgi:hypothetical protein
MYRKLFRWEVKTPMNRKRRQCTYDDNKTPSLKGPNQIHMKREGEGEYGYYA